MGFTIKIDHREHDERIQKAAHYYKSKGDNVTVKELLIGDYVFNNQVCFEYKTMRDFIQSVESGRVFNQAIDQSTGFPYHFVIIVASDYEKHEYFDGFDGEAYVFGWDNYDGAISRLNTFTTVKECSTEERAIKYMRQQARKCLDNKHVIKRLKTKTDNPAFNYLTLIKHVGDDTAELIVDNLGISTLDELLHLTNNDLQAIKGIGSQKAGIVIRAIRKDRYDRNK